MASDVDRRSGEGPDRSTTSDGDAAYSGLFRRCRRKKLLGLLPGQTEEDRRIVEVGIIVASPDEWDRSEEAHETGWDPVNLDGIIIAERTIG